MEVVPLIDQDRINLGPAAASDEERANFLKHQRRSMTVLAALILWNKSRGQVYMGTVSAKEKARRRAKGKVAKRSRKINRGNR